MPSFSARLHLPGQTRLPLSVEVDVFDERLRITAGERLVADWSLAEAEFGLQKDGFHVSVDSEEMVLNIADVSGFAAVLGIPAEDLEVSGPRDGSAARSWEDLKELRYEDVERRIADVAALMTSPSVPPSEVFTRWLRLLKEINARHGSGSIPTHVFSELNGRLLELMPEPGSEGGATAAS